MQKMKWAGITMLALALALSADAQPPASKKLGSLKERLSIATNYKETAVEKFLQALGPAAREQLENGREVALPGLGTLRVVRVEAYKDLVKGVVSTIPARNYIEFVPAGDLDKAANAAEAVPARSVPAYEFIVNPNHTPAQRAESNKVQRTRIGR